MKLDWKTCIKVAVCAFGLFLAITYWGSIAGFIGLIISAASPLIIGSLIAYIINLLMSFYEKHLFNKTKNQKLIKAKRPVCIVIAFITFVAVIGLIIWLVLPQFVSCIMIVVDYSPDAVDWIVTQLEKLE